MELWIFAILTGLRFTCTALTRKGWGLMVVLVQVVPDPAEEPADCNVTIQLCWFRGRITLLGVIQGFTISPHNYLCHKMSECVSQSSCVSRQTYLHLLQVMIALVYYFWAFPKLIIMCFAYIYPFVISKHYNLPFPSHHLGQWGAVSHFHGYFTWSESKHSELTMLKKDLYNLKSPEKNRHEASALLTSVGFETGLSFMRN